MFERADGLFSYISLFIEKRRFPARLIRAIAESAENISRLIWGVWNLRNFGGNDAL